MPNATPSETALILAAHGSSRRAEAAGHVAALAETVRANLGFKAAATIFAIGGPQDGAIDLGGAGQAVAVPLMMSDGQLAETVVHRIEAGGARLIVADPVGMRPEIADIAADMAIRAAESHGWTPRDINILLVAHGSGSRPESRRNGERHAGRIRTMHRFRGVKLALLEEEPTIADALAALEGPVCVVGLFAAPGGHALDDVPAEIAASGRPRVVYAGLVGMDEAMADLVARCAMDALHGDCGV